MTHSTFILICLSRGANYAWVDEQMSFESRGLGFLQRRRNGVFLLDVGPAEKTLSDFSMGLRNQDHPSMRAIG